MKILRQNEGRCYCLKGDQERNVKRLREAMLLSEKGSGEKCENIETERQ